MKRTRTTLLDAWRHIRSSFAGDPLQEILRPCIQRLLLAGLPILVAHADGSVREQVVHRYYSPSGSLAATGERREAPTRFTEAGFASTVQGLPVTGDTTLVLHFTPGVHAGVVLRVGGPANRPFRDGSPSPSWSIRNLSIHVQGEGGHPSETVLQFPADRYEGAGPNGYTETGMISIGDITPDSRNYVSFASVGGGRLSQARKVVIENLTLDCNWRSQRAYGSLYSPLSYKIYGAHVIAARGRFRNLIVRDHGSHGMICHSRFDNRAGVENFPLMVQAVDEGQEPTHDYSQAPSTPLPQGRPWLVEGCEVHGFNNSWGGYNTAVMFNVSTRNPRAPTEAAYINHHPPAELFGDSSRRFALVRNNQIRGGAYAFGQAGPGSCVGSTFAGNVGLGASGAYNADTSAVLSADITNNVFFDGRTGVRQVTHGFGGPVSINFHNISGNLFRLDTYQPFPIYMDYRLHLEAGSQVYLRTVSDPNMVLGAMIFSPMACLTLDGSTRGVRFEDNLITTRPSNQRNLPLTPSTGQTDFRAIWYPGPNDTIGHFESGTFLRPTSTDVQVSRNWLSSEADTFVKATRLSGDGRYDRFDGSTVSASGHLSPLKPRTASLQQTSPDGRMFQHQGTTERLLLFNEYIPQRFMWRRPIPSTEKALETVSVTLNDQPQLAAVGEVQIATPTLDTSTGISKYRGYARLIRHRLPKMGGDMNSDQVGTLSRTEPFQGSNPVRIVVSGPVAVSIDTVADSRGFVFYEFKLPQMEANQLFKITVYWNEKSSTSSDSNPWGDSTDRSGNRIPGSPEIYQYRCAISSIQVHPKTKVDITVTPDVANDRIPSFLAQRPVFTVRRSGYSSITEPLTVTIGIPSLSRWRFLYDSSTDRVTHSMQPANATYGTSSGQDYTLQTSSYTISTFHSGQQQAFHVKILPGTESTSFTLVPRYDDLTEEEVVTLRVLPGEHYIAGTLPEATVSIYDGPEFVIREVTDSNSYNGASKALAINSDREPIVAGLIYGSTARGGLWSFPDLNGRFSQIQPSDPVGFSHEPLGISDTVGGSYLLVGSRWTGSKRIPWAGGIGNPLPLPTLTSGMAGEAYAVAKLSADETWIVGWSQRSMPRSSSSRPTLWRYSSAGIWTVDDLSPVGSSVINIEGQANSINNDKTIGGWVRIHSTGTTPPSTYGFHITGGRTHLSIEEDLRFPIGIQSIGTTIPNTSSALYDTASLNTSCGVSVLGIPASTNAAIWRTGEISAHRLKVPPNPRDSIVHSDALLIIPKEFPLQHWKDRPIGRIWTNSISTAIAVVWPTDNNPPIPLDDHHLTLNPNGWRIERPMSVNRTGSIVGFGNKNGISKGFVLVSRR